MLFRHAPGSPFNSLLLLVTLIITFSFIYVKLNEVTELIAPQNVTVPTTSKPFAWDTYDGVGYQFREVKPAPLDPPRYEKLEKLPACDGGKVQEEVKRKIEAVKTEFLECIKPVVQLWRGKPVEMNVEWVEKARVCDKLQIFQSLNVVPIPNIDEIKWMILPKCKEENVLLTIGIGQDTVAEETLNRTLPNTKFYGADPIIEPNRRLFSSIGKFFPFAIGRNSGFTKFRVLPNQMQKTRNYVDEDVITIDFIYFLKHILKLKKIDFAWIDTEGGEFEILDQLHKDGPLDKAGITICQFNFEIHSRFREPGAQIYHDFIFRVLEEQRYIFLNSLHTDVSVHRMYFLNVENEECLAKFFNDYS